MIITMRKKRGWRQRARKEEGGEVIVRLIAKSFHCRYTAVTKNSKDGERLKERRTQHSRSASKLIYQDFPSHTS
jgi:hypothetical protein